MIETLLRFEKAKHKLDQLRLSCRYEVVHDEFSNLHNILENMSLELVDGILLDLGVRLFNLMREIEDFRTCRTHLWI